MGSGALGPFASGGWATAAGCWGCTTVGAVATTVGAGAALANRLGRSVFRAATAASQPPSPLDQLVGGDVGEVRVDVGSLEGGALGLVRGRGGLGAGGLQVGALLGGCLGALAHGGANGEPRDSASAAGAGVCSVMGSSGVRVDSGAM